MHLYKASSFSLKHFIYLSCIEANALAISINNLFIYKQIYSYICSNSSKLKPVVHEVL